MEVRETLSQLSPAERAVIAMRLAEKRKAPQTPALPKVQADEANRYAPFPLSDIQEAYLIGRSESVELGNIACSTYAEIEISNFDHARFECALNKLIQRHEMLRCIVEAEGYQQILKSVPPYRVSTTDLSADPNPEAALAEWRAKVSQQLRPSDQWPLFDFRVSLLPGGKVRLHISFDLLICDARSFEIIFGELAELYANPESELPPVALSFRDYMIASELIKQTEAYKASRDYWERRISTLPPAPELPLATNLSAISRPIFRRRTARLDKSNWNNIRQQAAQNNVTPAGVLLAAYSEVLAVWSKNPRFTINLTLFNRLPLHPDVNAIIGDFTSVTLLEVDKSLPKSFATHARGLQEQLWRDLDYRHFSGLQVMRQITRAQGIGPKALMPVVFTSFLNLGDANSQALGAARLGEVVHAVSQTPQVYLDCIVNEDEHGLIINWDAVDEAFPAGLLDDLFAAYERQLNALAADPRAWSRTPVEAALALIPEEQISQRAEINDTAAPLTDELLHTPFIEQVKKNPHRIAIQTPSRRLTYAELHDWASRVEAELLKRNVRPNQLVGVLMEKGWEQVAAVLGIHFAGAAYLPIDSELPGERQKYLIEHGQVGIVLTQSWLAKSLSLGPEIKALALDSLPSAGDVPVTVRRRQQQEDLAYVIYTSGSTGFPKGVMIDHRGAVNTVVDINSRYKVTERDSVLALSKLSFDLSVYDIFGLLAAGGKIVMPAADYTRDAAHWVQLISSNKITLWNTVPALMQMLVDEGERAKIQSLRVVMMSGDWIPLNLPNQIRKLAPSAEIHSLGGATEASIWSISYPIGEIDPRWKSVPYGKPMLNQSFHVLDTNFAPKPNWVPGQLFIGGVGLAKGYWRDEAKTNNSFVQNPITGERLYRTGDLGRYLPDGNIEFLGREDFQVKVQGHRIELGEIEVTLQQHPTVETGIVIVHQDKPSERRLVAYVVPRTGRAPKTEQLREFLRTKLPDYMVPSTFIFLDHFPLSSNGKVDRKALPEPIQLTNSEAHTVARDALEKQLTNLWEAVLKIRPIGLNDNFFDLGGHSLLAARMFSELRKISGCNLPLSTLFHAPTVEKLAEVIRSKGYTTRWSSLVPMRAGGKKPVFYCVHGAGGNVLLFRELCGALGEDYPFYGLQAQGLDGEGPYLRTVEEMASHYIDEIRQLQPRGPYYLGGFCMGGLIAYEMAIQLRKQNEEIALLALIDTYNFNGIPLRLGFADGVSQVGQKILFHWSNLTNLSLNEQMYYLLKKARGAMTREIERLGVILSNLRGLNHAGERRDGRNVFLERLNEDAHFTYAPQLYDGKMVVFKPRRNYSYLRDPQMGWNDFARDGMELVELPVDAGGIFTEPYVKTLADELRKRIDTSSNGAK